MEYLFVIDTNKYAGNFNREMGAYLTGVLENEYFSTTAEKLAQLYKDETGDVDKYGSSSFENIVGSHDWDGVHDPDYTDIFDGEAHSDSVALIFNTMPNITQVKLLQERATKFPDAYRSVENHESKKVKVLGFRWFSRDDNWKEFTP